MTLTSISLSRLLFRRILISVFFVLFFFLLNQPSILMMSKLGFTAWYPATGLMFALLLGVSPLYLPLAALTEILSGVLFYHQPLISWTSLVAPVIGTGSYAVAAYLLRGRVKIDLRLSHRRDVVRYALVTMVAGIAATLVGVASLAADHTITWSQYWDSAGGWFIGDATSLLGFSPFLLIHVLPRVRSYLAGEGILLEKPVQASHAWRPTEILELVGQIVCIPLTLWLMFDGPFPSKQLYYLAFVPIIWVGMRHGIQRVVTALVILNFGIPISLRLFPPSADVLAKVGFLMMVVSATGLIVGSAVTERHRIARQLSDQTAYLNSLIENNPLGIIVHDRHGIVQLCNDAFETLFLFRRDEILGKAIDAFIVPPESLSQGSQFVSQVAAGRSIHETLRRRRKDGVLIDVELHAVPLLTDGQVSAAFAIYKDVSDQIKAAAMLQERSEILSQSVNELQLRNTQLALLGEMSDLLQCCEGSPEATAIVAEFGKRLFAQAASGDLFLFKSSRNALEAETHWGDSPSSEVTFTPNTCWALLRGKAHWSLSPAGQVACAHLTQVSDSIHLCVPMMARGETLGILHLQYVQSENLSAHMPLEDWRQTQQQFASAVAGQMALSLASLRLREALRDQSIRDPLTGLFNRRFMQESLDRELQRAVRKSRPLAVIFLDLDHFKRFNDIYGHDAGDTLLQQMADLFRGYFRRDDVICRYGGEEFAIVLPESTVENAATRMAELADRARSLIVLHEGKRLDTVTFSTGIAAFPEHGSSPSALLRSADQALYRSKSDGRDRVTIAMMPGSS